MTSSQDSCGIHLFCTMKWKGDPNSKSNGERELTVKVITIYTSVEGHLPNGRSLRGVETEIRDALQSAHKDAQSRHGATKAKIFSNDYKTTFTARFAHYTRRSRTLGEVITNHTPKVTTHDHRSTALLPGLFTSGAITTHEHIRTHGPPSYQPSGDPPPYSRH